MTDIIPEARPTVSGRFRESAQRIANILGDKQLQLGARILAGGVAAEPVKRFLGGEPQPLDLSTWKPEELLVGGLAAATVSYLVLSEISSRIGGGISLRRKGPVRNEPYFPEDHKAKKSPIETPALSADQMFENASKRAGKSAGNPAEHKIIPDQTVDAEQMMRTAVERARKQKGR